MEDSPDPLVRLSLEIDLLKREARYAAGVDPDVLELVATNGPPRGL